MELFFGKKPLQYLLFFQNSAPFSKKFNPEIAKNSVFDNFYTYYEVEGIEI